MRWILVKSWLITFGPVVLLLSTSCAAMAQHIFNLVDDLETPGFVFATLELAKLPATHEDVVSLTFPTELGDPFFFGTSFPGTFDEMSEPGGQFVMSSRGGLTGTDSNGNDYAIIRDFTPPSFVSRNPYLPNGATVLSFDLYASVFDDRSEFTDQSQFSSLDRIELRYQLPDGSTLEIGRVGFWRPVPESSGFAHAAIVISFAIGAIRQNRKVVSH